MIKYSLKEIKNCIKIFLIIFIFISSYFLFKNTADASSIREFLKFFAILLEGGHIMVDDEMKEYVETINKWIKDGIWILEDIKFRDYLTEETYSTKKLKQI